MPDLTEVVFCGADKRTQRVHLELGKLSDRTVMEWLLICDIYNIMQ